MSKISDDLDLQLASVQLKPGIVELAKDQLQYVFGGGSVNFNQGAPPTVCFAQGGTFQQNIPCPNGPPFSQGTPPGGGGGGGGGGGPSAIDPDEESDDNKDD